MKKIHRQLSWSVKKPPSSGPPTLASANTAPK
jgi:hypothetical protein